MNEGVYAEVKGLPDIKAALAGIAPKLRLRALRNALAAGARVVRQAARKATPVMNPLAPGNRYAYRKGYRKPGTVQRAISIRTSKVAKRAGNVGVFVNVRPVKGAARGGKSSRDPFYWRFLAFGTQKMRAFPFLEAGASKLPEALQIFLQRIGPAIEKLNKPKAPAP